MKGQRAHPLQMDGPSSEHLVECCRSELYGNMPENKRCNCIRNSGLWEHIQLEQYPFEARNDDGL